MAIVESEHNLHRLSSGIEIFLKSEMDLLTNNMVTIHEVIFAYREDGWLDMNAYVSDLEIKSREYMKKHTSGMVDATYLLQNQSKEILKSRYNLIGSILEAIGFDVSDEAEESIQDVTKHEKNPISSEIDPAIIRMIFKVKSP